MALVVGDNVTPERSFLTLSFDGEWPELGERPIWECSLVDGPSNGGELV